MSVTYAVSRHGEGDAAEWSNSNNGPWGLGFPMPGNVNSQQTPTGSESNSNNFAGFFHGLPSENEDSGDFQNDHLCSLLLAHKLGKIICSSRIHLFVYVSNA